MENVYTNTGTNYGKECIARYDSSRDWACIKKFVAPYLLPDLENSKSKIVLDAGCGTGLWAIHGAKHGASVYGIDIQKEMIDEAIVIASNVKIQNPPLFSIGNVAELEFADNFFDKLISINVACNLPLFCFYAHFQEFSRVLKETEQAIIVAPYSLEVIFTDGTLHQHEAIRKIERVLENLKNNPSPTEIRAALDQLENILSATFTLRNNRLVLVTKLDQLREGQEIWRKLPNLSLPNYFYTEKSYLQALNLPRLKEKDSCFSTTLR